MELFEKYYTYAIKFLSYRPRSEKELHDSLLRKKAPLDIIAKVILLLKEQRFLNDDEFARWFVEQRTTFRPRSKRALRMELKLKGIDQELIEKYLTENQETAVSDLGQATLLIGKNLKKYRHLKKAELYQKLGGVLARKGFSWDTIKRAIDLALAQDK